jgi:DNA modification methylase
MADNAKQLALGDDDRQKKAQQPVECLGLTFGNEAARRTYFLDILREKLKDPEFRAIEGFPIGEDEDILALSDPPYYTACPNPFVEDFIKCYGKPYLHKADSYKREPFTADVSEGKNDPIYNAHSYHTKVPHKAIMRYVLHYTEPGDVVFDGFCGTGMTGVATQLCANKPVIESLGFSVKENGEIIDESGQVFSKIGARKSLLIDLSPAATFIARNYNSPLDSDSFKEEAEEILYKIDQECGWMYETSHIDGREKAKINYTVWSEVFYCPDCSAEIVYADVAIDSETQQVKPLFSCPSCKKSSLNKKSLERSWETQYDSALGQTIKLVKYKPVLLNCQYGDARYEKKPNADDLKLLERIESLPIENWIPVLKMIDGERKTKDGYHLKGITHLHHFYFPRQIIILAKLWDEVPKNANLDFTKFFIQGSSLGFTKMNRYSANHFSQVNRYFSGTLFVGSLISEVSPKYSMTNKLRRLGKLSMPGKRGDVSISCQSSTKITELADNSIDYAFIDPPFGNNLHYSELNFHWEAWLKVLTERIPEAVMDKGRSRDLLHYQQLMQEAFSEVFRILKPGRWLTVEFHNSKNSVWNAIQEAIQLSGFVIADVRTLDKQQETYKQSIQKLVKQDLVISAYKPNNGLEERFKLTAGTEEGVWDFVRTHLGQLPHFIGNNGRAEVIPERQEYLIYDRMVAFHFKHGITIPISFSEFCQGLRQRFELRDGMFFLSHQAIEYDRKRINFPDFLQLEFLVTDEESAIRWVRQELAKKPQDIQELTPKFMREAQRSWAKYERLFELRELLAENFLFFQGVSPIPPQIVSWLKTSSTHRDKIRALENALGDSDNTTAGLATDNAALLAAARDRWYIPDPNNASQLEQLREQKLLKEFDGYCQSTQRKLKQFRLEAIRAGFKKCWQEKTEDSYRTIVTIADKLPANVLEEDTKLFRFYQQAITRLGDR